MWKIMNSIIVTGPGSALALIKPTSTAVTFIIASIRQEILARQK